MEIHGSCMADTVVYLGVSLPALVQTWPRLEAIHFAARPPITASLAELQSLAKGDVRWSGERGKLPTDNKHRRRLTVCPGAVGCGESSYRHRVSIDQFSGDQRPGMRLRNKN